MNNKVTFKPYDMNQLKLPIDLAIDIPENHLVTSLWQSTIKKRMFKKWTETLKLDKVKKSRF